MLIAYIHFRPPSKIFPTSINGRERERTRDCSQHYSDIDTERDMVLILEISEMGAHVRSNLCYLPV